MGAVSFDGSAFNVLAVDDTVHGKMVVIRCRTCRAIVGEWLMSEAAPTYVDLGIIAAGHTAGMHE